MSEIKCPYDLNQFLLGEPLFTNTFLDNECEKKKFYGDCFHCFATSISQRDKRLINSVLGKIRAEIESNMESIIGKYDSSIPKSNMPSYKIERNKVREECISIIDKYKDKGVEE